MGFIKVETFDTNVTTNGSTYVYSNSFPVGDGFVRKISSTDKATGPVGSTGNTGPANSHCGIQLQAASNELQFFKGNGTNQKIVGEIWRYTGPVNGADSFNVIGQLSVTLNSGQLTNNVAVTGFTNIDKVVPIFNGLSTTNTGTSDYNDSTVSVHINDLNQLVVSRGAGTGTITAYITLVEFTGANWVVGHAISTNHDNTSENVTLNSRNSGVGGSIIDIGSWSHAMIIEATMAGDSGETGLADCLGLVSPSTNTSVTYSVVEADSNARNDQSAYIHVISNQNMIVNRAQNLDLTEGNNSFGTISLPPGTSPATLEDDLAIEWFSSTTGTGTAHARGRLATRIIDQSGTRVIQHWVHRSGNNIRVHYGSVDLRFVDGQIRPILSSAPSNILRTTTNVTVQGTNFGNLQGAGKIELWSDEVGTIRREQNVNIWSDTSIQFDVIDTTGILDGNIYIVVTIDNGSETLPFQTILGLLPYSDIINLLSPDHHWSLDNNYNDKGVTGPIRDMTTDIVNGGGAFTTNTIAEDSTHSWLLSATDQRRGCQDSVNMNVTNAFTQRTMGGWIQLNQIQQIFSSIYKEGGGVNNLAFVTGMGNILMAAFADTGDDNAQAYSDFRLAPNRPYHIMFWYDYVNPPREFRLYIDGRLQSSSDGNPLTSTNLDSHSGDINWGSPDTTLETGGTDITYLGQNNTQYSHWCTWSTNSANKGALTETEILSLFRRGALPFSIIASDTPENMQIALDGTSNVRENWPLSYRILEATNSPNLTLDMIDKVFDSSITEHLEWRGGGTLTINALGTTNIDINKTFSSGGLIIINREVPIRIEVLDINTRLPISGARIYLRSGPGGIFNDGDLVVNNLTGSDGVYNSTILFNGNHSLIGKVRQGTGFINTDKSLVMTYNGAPTKQLNIGYQESADAILYKSQPVSSIVTSEGLDITVLMRRDQ